MANPEVVRRAAAAPEIGQGLGSTMWKGCAWWAIRCFLVSIGSVGGRKRMLGL